MRAVLALLIVAVAGYMLYHVFYAAPIASSNSANTGQSVAQGQTETPQDPQRGAASNGSLGAGSDVGYMLPKTGGPQ